jgi:hypothetical protein
MEYQYSNYLFEFKFNPDDIVVQINKEKKTWQNVYLLDEINKKNPFFDSMEKIKKLIDNCFSKEKENFHFELDYFEKNLQIIFYWTNDFGSNKLQLLFHPVRKDISVNQEVIDLKKYVRKLENKFKGFHFNNNLSQPLSYHNNGSMIFSDIDLNTIFVKIYPNHYFKIGSNGQISNIQNSSFNIDQFMEYSYNNTTVIDPESNFMNEEFSFLSLETVGLCDLHNQKLKYLPSNVKRLFIKGCTKLDFYYVNLPNLENLYLDYQNINNEASRVVYEPQIKSIAKFLRNLDIPINVYFHSGYINGKKYFTDTNHTYYNIHNNSKIDI